MEKKRIIVITIGVLLLLWIIGKFIETNEDSTEIANKEEIKEEMPPVEDTIINAGLLQTNQEGYTIDIPNERTILQDLLQNTDLQYITIDYIFKSLPPYENIPMQLVYDGIHKTLKVIYTKNNVIEEYSEVCRECLIDFLKAGETSFYSISNFCKDSKYDFNNREMTIHAVGERPEQSELDGSVKIVKDYIKNITKKPSSVEFKEWSKVTSAGEFWVVRCKFQAKNSFDDIVTNNVWFYIQNGEVVKMKSLD